MLSTAQARRSWCAGMGACFDCALAAHFRTWWSLLVADAMDTSCFGGPKSTFRGRCRGGLLRCANFVLGAVLWTRQWSSARSALVAGAMSRDLWTGSLSEAEHFVNLEVAAAVLCGP